MRRALPLVLLLALAVRGTAQAHAALVSSEPAPGEQVRPDVGVIRLTFDQPVIPGSTLTLYTGDFQEIAGLQMSVEDRVLTAAVPAPLPAGVYTVQWLAVSTDGHTAQGTYQFGVSQPPAAWPLVAWPAAAAVVLLGAIWAWRRRPARGGSERGGI